MAKRYAGFLGLQQNMDPPGFGTNKDGNTQGAEVLPGIYAADGGGRSATGGRGGQKPKTASSSIGARGTAASSPPPTGKSAADAKRLQAAGERGDRYQAGATKRFAKKMADAKFRAQARQDANDRKLKATAARAAAAQTKPTAVAPTTAAAIPQASAAPKRRIPI